MNGKIELGLAKTLQRGVTPPANGRVAVRRHASAVEVGVAEIELGHREALFRCLLIPPEGLRGARSRAEPPFAHDAERELSASVALLSHRVPDLPGAFVVAVVELGLRVRQTVHDGTVRRAARKQDPEETNQTAIHRAYATC